MSGDPYYAVEVDGVFSGFYNVDDGLTGDNFLYGPAEYTEATLAAELPYFAEEAIGDEQFYHNVSFSWVGPNFAIGYTYGITQDLDYLNTAIGAGEGQITDILEQGETGPYAYDFVVGAAQAADDNIALSHIVPTMGFISNDTGIIGDSPQLSGADYKLYIEDDVVQDAPYFLQIVDNASGYGNFSDIYLQANGFSNEIGSVFETLIFPYMRLAESQNADSYKVTTIYGTPIGIDLTITHDDTNAVPIDVDDYLTYIAFPQALRQSVLGQTTLELDDAPSAIDKLAVSAIQGFAVNDVTEITSTGAIQFNVAQALALYQAGVTIENTSASISDAAANIEALTAGQIANIASLGISSLAANSGPLDLNAVQLNACLQNNVTPSSPSGVVFDDSVADIRSFNLSALSGLGVTAVQSDDNPAVTPFTLTLAQTLTLQGESIPATDTKGDFVAVADTNAHLGDGALTPSEIDTLAAYGVKQIESDDVSLDLNAAQIDEFLNDGVSAGAPASDRIVFSDSIADIDAFNWSQLPTLDVTEIQSTDDPAVTPFTLSIQQALILGDDDIIAVDANNNPATIADTVGNIEALSTATIDTLAGDGYTTIATSPAGVLDLNANQVIELVDDHMKISNASATILDDSPTPFDDNQLRSQVLSQLVQTGVTGIHTSGPVDIYAAQFLALPFAVVAADGKPSTIRDVAAAIQNLTPAQIATMPGLGFMTLDADDVPLTFNVLQTQSIVDDDIFTEGPKTDVDSTILSDAAATIEGLSAAVIGDLDEHGYGFIQGSGTALQFRVDQAKAVADAGVVVSDPLSVLIGDTATDIDGVDPTLLPALAEALDNAGATTLVEATDGAEIKASIALTLAVVKNGFQFQDANGSEIYDTASDIDGLAAAQLPTLAKAFAPNGAPTLIEGSDGNAIVSSIALAEAVANGNFEFDDSSGVEIDGATSAFEKLGPSDYALLHAAVDGPGGPNPTLSTVLRTTDGLALQLTLNNAQAVLANGFTFDGPLSIEITGSIKSLLALTPQQVALLAGVGENTSVTVAVTDTAADIDALTPSQIMEISTFGISTITSTDNSLEFNTTQAIDLAANGLHVSVPSGDSANVADGVAAIEDLTSAQFGEIGAEFRQGPSQLVSVAVTDDQTLILGSLALAASAAADKIVFSDPAGYQINDNATNIASAAADLTTLDDLALTLGTAHRAPGTGGEFTVYLRATNSQALSFGGIDEALSAYGLNIGFKDAQGAVFDDSSTNIVNAATDPTTLDDLALTLGTAHRAPGTGGEFTVYLQTTDSQALSFGGIDEALSAYGLNIGFKDAQGAVFDDSSTNIVNAATDPTTLDDLALTLGTVHRASGTGGEFTVYLQTTNSQALSFGGIDEALNAYGLNIGFKDAQGAVFDDSSTNIVDAAADPTTLDDLALTLGTAHRAPGTGGELTVYLQTTNSQALSFGGIDEALNAYGLNIGFKDAQGAVFDDSSTNIVNATADPTTLDDFALTLGTAHREPGTGGEFTVYLQTTNSQALSFGGIDEALNAYGLNIGFKDAQGAVFDDSTTNIAKAVDDDTTLDDLALTLGTAHRAPGAVGEFAVYLQTTNSQALSFSSIDEALNAYAHNFGLKDPQGFTVDDSSTNIAKAIDDETTLDDVALTFGTAHRANPAPAISVEFHVRNNQLLVLPGVDNVISGASDGFGFVDSGGVVVSDTASNFMQLTTQQIALIVGTGVTQFSATTGSVSFNAAQALALEDPVDVVVPAGDTVTLSDAAAAIEALTAAQIQGLATIGFTNLDSSDASLQFTVAQALAIEQANLTVTEPAGDTATVVDTPANLAMLTPADIAALGALGVSAACYVKGTHILTERGEVAVEGLRIGDLAVTASGRRRPICWLGHRALDLLRHRDPVSVRPVLVHKGAFGENLPHRDLWLSPGHNIAWDGVLIAASSLVNGRSIEQVERDHIEYWHVELDAHDVIFAEGLPAESYLDTGNRAAFDNGGAFVEAHPDFAPRHWADTCLPMATGGPEIAPAKAHLLARLADRGCRLTQEADARVCVDGVSVEPIQLGATRLAFVLPAGGREIVLRSRVFVPAHSVAESRDTRSLGLCVGALQIDGSKVALADNEACACGWREAEFQGEHVSHRWTTGATPLPAGVQIVILDMAGTGQYLIGGDAPLAALSA